MSEPRRLLDELKVASLLIYPSRPRSKADREARDVIWTGLKQGRPQHVQRVAARLASLALQHPARELVSSSAIFVPAPRSTPLSRGAMWPALEIANALLAHGLGSKVAPFLERREPVRRSTGARTAQDREPPMRHFETISSSPLSIRFLEDAHFVLVDDVVTTGSTLIACASHLRLLAPKATITAFAAARADRNATLGHASEMLAPLVETIRLLNDAARPRRS